MKNPRSQTLLRNHWKTDRLIGFLVILLAYVIALVIGLIVYHAVDQSIWARVFYADLAATLVIWICSLILGNASVYDPYWSVQPILILPLLLLQKGTINSGILLLCLMVILWGGRLTINWGLTFHGLDEQDWRYDRIKARTGVLYPLVNLLGIQLMPTLIVFACITPVIELILHPPVSLWTLLPGLLLCLTGILLESIADRQMRDFRLKNPQRSAIIQTGLWKHSRHPNYLGEILMWWGAFIACLVSRPQAWFLGLGALLNTALFLFISIPLAERRLAEYKVGFADYLQRTRMLLPFPKKGR